MTVINMQTMRYINLLDKVSRVKTRRCFIHNNAIFFAVKREEVSKAIGSNAVNVKKIQIRIGKKIRIIRDSEGLNDMKRFIEDIVSPVKIRAVEVKDNRIVITAGSNQTRASLIGRDKHRYDELKKILVDTYGLELKIV